MPSQPRCTENTGHTEVIGSGRQKLESRFVSVHVVSAYQGTPVVKPPSQGLAAHSRVNLPEERVSQVCGGRGSEGLRGEVRS